MSSPAPRSDGPVVVEVEGAVAMVVFLLPPALVMGVGGMARGGAVPLPPEAVETPLEG